jgi:hypothetical protein
MTSGLVQKSYRYPFKSRPPTIQHEFLGIPEPVGIAYALQWSEESGQNEEHRGKPPAPTFSNIDRCGEEGFREPKRRTNTYAWSRDWE